MLGSDLHIEASMMLVELRLAALQKGEIDPPHRRLTPELVSRAADVLEQILERAHANCNSATASSPALRRRSL